MRIVSASLLFTLSACAIIGDPKDPNESDSGTSTSGTAGTSTSTGTAGTATTGVTGSTGDTTGSTTDPRPTSGPTTGPIGCTGLDELACADTLGCRPVLGVPFDFGGCAPNPAFLGCIDDVGCDDALTVVCRDNSLEVYQLPDTCIPPGFSPCDTDLPLCEDACLGLDEQACLDDFACSGHYGAPHVMQNDMLCADYNNLEFLACQKLLPPCPPVVLTVCPIGQPDSAFEVASGCLPPGYENCGDGVIASCP